MIIWSGHGYLVAVVVFASSFATELATESVTANDEFYQRSTWPLPLALLIAAGITLAFDRLLFAHSDGNHTLFFIPLKWWSPILAAIAVVAFAYRAATLGA